MFKVRIQLFFTLVVIFCIASFEKTAKAQILDAPVYKNVIPKSKSFNYISSCSIGKYSDTIEKNTVRRKLPKKVRSMLKSMMFIDGGCTDIACENELEPTDKDSNLLFFFHNTKICTNSFLLGEKEVTNKEYRDFVYWVRDSIARAYLAMNDPKYYSDPEKRILNWDVPIDWNDSALETALYLEESGLYYRRKDIDSRKMLYKYGDGSGTEYVLNVYPDTLCWVHEFPYSFNEPMTQMYFWHPAYDYYPVVGVTCKQALAYCHWKTDQLQKKMDADDDLRNIEVAYRLPTEIEWEYAAQGKRDMRIYYYGTYPWDSNSYNDKEGKCYSNTGSVRNENGLVVISPEEDYFIHTGPVGFFEKNYFGLYDMGGNVSEWTCETPCDITLKTYFGCWPVSDSLLDNENTVITEKDNVQTIIDRLVAISLKREESLGENASIYEMMIDTTDYYNFKILKIRAGNLLHDYHAIQNEPHPKIVKGGSWADSYTYMMTGMDQVFSEDSSSCKVGFRLAMTIPDELLPYVYDTKYVDLQSKKIKKHFRKSLKKNSKLRRHFKKQRIYEWRDII